ncbi:MAG: tetratricopeptide repeat protein [Rubrivivax sp.]|nr:tetratricopeptide repeat protein [Rubrivivax sp.]
MSQPVPRTLLFTDVVDSTALAERLGDAAMADLWLRHDLAARELLARHGGREIDRSDGFLLLFDAPAPAAAFAAAYHEVLAGLGLSARAGLHHGAVTLRDNAAHEVARGAKPLEVDGLAKPLAARLMALAGGGRTLASAAACAALDAEAAGLAVLRHGHYRLKGVSEPMEVCELAPAGSPPAPPPGDTDKAYAVLRVEGDSLWQPRRDVHHNLPRERDAFVGRGHELAALADHLQDGDRLVTLLGPGGTGKTRLVRRYARAWLGDWPGGVYFCDLSEARSLDGLCYAVALALEVPIASGDAVARLGHAISGRGRCLVILDNVEQLVDHASVALGAWLDRAADASFVITSRERLQLPGEAVMAVEPLPTADDAIALFDVRARAQRADYAADRAQHEAVARIVQMLDGLPLAIELAAARVRVLSPTQIVERLRDRFTLLAGARGASARQATLRAAIDWSWRLLAPWEQAALAQCAVFEGGFTLAAAERVIELAAWPEAPPVLDVVQALLDKSLLHVAAARARLSIDEPWFGMYVSIHEYARERLRAVGPQEVVRAEWRHGSHYAALGERAALEALSSHGGAQRRRALALELDNLVAACHRAIDRDDGDVAAATYCAAWEVLDVQGPFAPANALGAQVLALPSLSQPWRLAAGSALARAARAAGRSEDGAAAFAEALALARQLGDRRAEGALLTRLGDLRAEQAQLETARGHLEAALVVTREAADPVMAACAQGNLAIVLQYQGRIDEARAGHEAALAGHRAAGNRSAESAALNNLAVLHHEQGRLAEALALHQQALALRREQGDRVNAASSLGNIGNVHFDLGRHDECREFQQAALAIHREVGNRFFESIVLGNIAGLDQTLGRSADARAGYEAALAITREVGNRRHAAYLLGSLADVCCDEGRLDEAAVHFEAAIAAAHALQDRRTEGWASGGLARVHLRRGEIVAARTALGRGESLLREVGERVEAGRLVCLRGQLALAANDRDSASAALAEALAVAESLGVQPGSGLRRDLDALKTALE